MSSQLDQEMKEQILQLCTKDAGSHQITAISLYGPWVCGYADEKTIVNVLMILDELPIRFKTFFENVGDFKVSILSVYRLDFERDLQKGWMGEFFAEKVILPYKALKEEEYLWLNEVKTKKRIVLEILENLVLEFPESSHEFLIEKEYFLHEVLMKRAKVFPPLIYSLLNMFRGKLETANKVVIMEGYLKALEELEKENVIFSTKEYVRITKAYINAVKKRKKSLSPFLKTIQRVTLNPLLSVISDASESLIQEQRLYNKSNQKATADALLSRLENPKKHIIFKTPLGLVSLSDKSNIEDVARKIIPNGNFSKMKVKNIGGVLNDVYILTLKKDGKELKFIVKRYLDWSNLKWLPLTLWSLGTTTFSVLGHSRLEKEYAINRFLHSKNFPVPKVLHISHQNRLIFMELVEGESLEKVVKRLFGSNKTERDVALIREAGRRVAEAHNLGVSFGDCKPENFMASKDCIVLLDLEQASRDGNRVWDVAEFLYYSGHYSPTLASTKAATVVARSFIEGYLEAGGKKTTIKQAASARYTKVFSVFTAPHILFAISNVCQKIGTAK